MFDFRSLKKSLLIMATMPLTIFGAALGMLVTGYPFSITAFIGMVALSAIVVRNGIIYVHYAEELRADHGYGPEEAAVAAAKRRMRPIFLTAMAAAVGVIPMVPSGSALWGPLGSVICFGLLFALACPCWSCPSFIISSIRTSPERRSRDKSATKGKAYEKDEKNYAASGILSCLPASSRPGKLTLEESRRLALRNNVLTRTAPWRRRPHGKPEGGLHEVLSLGQRQRLRVQGREAAHGH